MNVAHETGINEGLKYLHGVVNAVVIIYHDLIHTNRIMVSYPLRQVASEVLRSNTGRDLSKCWGRQWAVRGQRVVVWCYLELHPFRFDEIKNQKLIPRQRRNGSHVRTRGLSCSTLACLSDLIRWPVGACY